MLKLYKYNEYRGRDKSLCYENVIYLIAESTKQNVIDILKPLVDKRIYLSDISEQDTEVQFSKSGIIDIITIDNPQYND